ncbi:putative phospholipase B-like 2 [Pristis pectinata]|uniref:putative phospholipase B-like 2 n=1 Tax=Pristis pectinata TaxID=685728 RepID=UPI00223DDEB8|nr:putative phospholipase B-like 2 [Pristis pectinata]
MAAARRPEGPCSHLPYRSLCRPAACHRLLSSLLLVAAAAVPLAAPETLHRSVVLDKHSGRLKVVQGLRRDGVAWANFTDNIKTTGWSYLELTTNGTYDDSIQAYAAGVVEAEVTRPYIYMHWMNTLFRYCGPFKYQTAYCDKLKNYIETNLAWVEENLAEIPLANDNKAYWHQVQLALLQLQGLEDGYNDHILFPTGKLNIQPYGLILFQMSGDLEDLENVFNKSDRSKMFGSGSCSALIKLLPGNKELLVSHDTWSNYQTMLRIIKKYKLSFKSFPGGDIIPGEVQAFSSYPGTIFSGDDFYVLSSGLVTLETTIGNNNAQLWNFVKPVGSVMEWLRNIVANRLATSGAEWAAIFKKFNSGTYNNQWMIVDYNFFTPGQLDINKNLLTLLEQIPGQIVIADKTDELMQSGYWASYNIPYFEEIFNASGKLALFKEYGDWFSYNKSPRALIFHRNQTMVTDMDSMIKLMRYNNFMNDSLSICQQCDPKPNGENSISARSDLNPVNGSYPFSALGQRSHGGTDMKVTSFELHKAYQMIAVSGPTWDEVPAFQWSKSPFRKLVHMGHPDLWRFLPVRVEWK